MHFRTQTEILKNAFVKLTFPIEYDKTYIANIKAPDLECHIKGIGDWEQKKCATNDKHEVTLEVGGGLLVGDYLVIVGKIFNPDNAIIQSSGQFSVSTYRQNGLVDVNHRFGNIPFTPKPGSILTAKIF